MMPLPPSSTLFPYTTLFRARARSVPGDARLAEGPVAVAALVGEGRARLRRRPGRDDGVRAPPRERAGPQRLDGRAARVLRVRQPLGCALVPDRRARRIPARAAVPRRRPRRRE